MIRGVLVDLSGTLHIDDLVIPGTIAALEKLRSLDLPVKFLTNTTKVDYYCFLFLNILGI